MIPIRCSQTYSYATLFRFKGKRRKSPTALIDRCRIDEMHLSHLSHDLLNFAVPTLLSSGFGSFFPILALGRVRDQVEKFVCPLKNCLIVVSLKFAFSREFLCQQSHFVKIRRSVVPESPIVRENFRDV